MTFPIGIEYNQTIGIVHNRMCDKLVYRRICQGSFGRVGVTSRPSSEDAVTLFRDG